jgi:uncharacterized membrane protein YsdA (DUF1294 family)
LKWILLGYLLSSIVTFVLYGFDKRRARNGGQRVRERTLHLWELVGGWPGAWIGQRVFRHKTQKTSFRLVFWAVVILHLALWGLWLFEVRENLVGAT